MSRASSAGEQKNKTEQAKSDIKLLLFKKKNRNKIERFAVLVNLLTDHRNKTIRPVLKENLALALLI